MRTLGQLTFAMCEKYVDDIVLVSEQEIESAIHTLLVRHKVMAEGAGAASVAGVMSGKLPLDGKKVVCVVSGGNLAPAQLTKILKTRAR